MGCCSSAEPRPQGRPASVEPRRNDYKQVAKTEAKAPERRDWPWTRPVPPANLKSTGPRRPHRANLPDFFYSSEYLKSFKILNTLEAEAYQAFLEQDLDRARAILESKDPNVRSPGSFPVSPDLEAAGLDATISPLSLDLDDLKERERGGSVAAVAMVPERGDGNRRSFNIPNVEKDKATHDLLLRGVVGCKLFKHLSRNFEEPEMIVKAMKSASFEPGTVIIKARADPEDRRGLYIVAAGTVTYHDEHGRLIEKRAGDVFGEALVTNIISESPSDIMAGPEGASTYVIDHELYATILSLIAFRRRNKYKEQLRNVAFHNQKPFAQLTEPDLAQLADALEERTYQPGETIIKYGEPGTHAHFVLKGRVEVIGRDNLGEPFKVCEFGEGEDPVGFLEFFNPGKPETCIADVVAKEGEAVCVTACISREHFEICVGPIQDLLKHIANSSDVYEYYREQKNTIKERRGTLV